MRLRILSFGFNKAEVDYSSRFFFRRIIFSRIENMRFPKNLNNSQTVEGQNFQILVFETISMQSCYGSIEMLHIMRLFGEK